MEGLWQCQSTRVSQNGPTTPVQMLPIHCTSNESEGVLLGALCALWCSMQFAIVESNTGHEHRVRILRIHWTLDGWDSKEGIASES